MSLMTKKTKQKKGQAKTLQEWMDEQYANDPGLKERVEDLVQEMELEQQLVKLREERGLSQTAVAARLGVSQPVVAKIESGRQKNLRMRTIVRYAAAVGHQMKISFQPMVGSSSFIVLNGGRRRKSSKRGGDGVGAGDRPGRGRGPRVSMR